MDWSPGRPSLERFDTAQKMKFSIKNFCSKCDQINLLKKPLMENFIFCAVWAKQFIVCNPLCYIIPILKNKSDLV